MSVVAVNEPLPAASNGFAPTADAVDGNAALPNNLVVMLEPDTTPATDARASKYRVPPAGIWIVVAVPPLVVTPTAMSTPVVHSLEVQSLVA